MKTHRLKTLPRYFDASARGDKNFELRENDRNFEVGDLVVLYEWDAIAQKPTGRELPARRITHVCQDVPAFGLRYGYAVLALADLTNFEISKSQGGNT